MEKSKSKFSRDIVIKKWSFGFSILEMLVVLFIIAIISVIVLVQNHQTTRRHKLQRAAQEFALNVRLAQAMALETRLVAGSVPNGFGIYLPNAASYLIFYNPDGVNDKGYVASSLAYKSFNLATGLSFSAGATKNVFFLKPNPDCYVNGCGPYQLCDQNFTIQDTTGNSLTVNVNDSCLVKI